MQERPEMNKPLEGLKVVAFTFGAAGPLTASTLAAYGAQVITVESRKRLDISRQIPPFIGNVSSPDRTLNFQELNNGKLGVTLNLKHPKARTVLKAMVMWADLVLESFAGGVGARLGLKYDDLAELRPDIVMVSEAIFGQTGPWAEVPGYGTPLTALTGFAHLTGFPDQVPQLPGRAFTDYITPRAAVLALVAALDYRRRTGKGQYIDCAQMEAAVPFLTSLLLEFQCDGSEAGKIGNRSTHACPHGAYRCRGDDRWCVITVNDDHQWQRFCAAIGTPTWTRDPRFGTALGRVKHADEMDALVEGWTVNHSPEEIMELLQAAGVGAGVVKAGEDLGNDPQLRHRHFYRKVERPGLGTMEYGGMPAQFSDGPYEIGPSPFLGEHNKYVYTKIVGLSDREFVELLEEGVFE